VGMLRAFARSQLRGQAGTSSLTLEAVEAFAADCGCAAVVAASKAHSTLSNHHHAKAAATGDDAADGGGGGGGGSSGILAPVEALLRLCLRNIGELAGLAHGGDMAPEHAVAVAEMRRAVLARLRDVHRGLTANGWHAAGEPLYYRQCAAALLSLAEGIVVVAGGSGGGGPPVALWQGQFLRDLAMDALVAGPGMAAA